MQCTIIRPSFLETTALGAARLAALAIGYWDMDDFKKQNTEVSLFKCSISKEESDKMYAIWQKAVEAARCFTK
jgi:glycerol kinase